MAPVDCRRIYTVRAAIAALRGYRLQYSRLQPYRETDRQTDGRTEINSVVTLYFSKSTESYDRIPSCVCASPCRLRCRHINLFWLTAWLIGGVMLAVGTLQDSREFHITFYVSYCLRHKLDQFLYHVHLTHHQQPH